jgi:hypothetical protein
VVFLGLAVAGPEEEIRLLKGLEKKFNLSPEKAERLLEKVPVIVKKGITQDEMERYVSAFESLGGRVRVEEEPLFQTPEVSIPPEPGKKLFAGRMITCPQCGFEQPDTDECVKCGLVISKYQQYQEMAHSFESQVREISSEDKYSPWESGEGFIWAFLRTTREALFEPTSFFRKVAAGEGYWPPLIYALIAGIIGSAGSMLWQWLIFSRLFPRGVLGPFFSYGLVLALLCAAIPFMVAFFILVSSAVLHLCLMIVGGRRKGFEATFRVVSYSWGGSLFGIIPFIGSTIGWIYALVLAIFGVREVHDISTGRAIVAVLLPYIVAAGVGILAAIMIPMFFGSMRFFGGVGV